MSPARIEGGKQPLLNDSLKPPLSLPLVCHKRSNKIQQGVHLDRGICLKPSPARPHIHPRGRGDPQNLQLAEGKGGPLDLTAKRPGYPDLPGKK